MNILVVAPVPFYIDRGTPIRILNEIRMAHSRGHTVRVVTYHIGDMPRELKDIGVSIVRIPALFFWYKKQHAGPSFMKYFLDILLWMYTVREIFIFKPDVIHAHGYEGVLIAHTARKIFFKKKMRLVGDFHGGLVSELVMYGHIRLSLFQKIFQFLEKRIYCMPDILVASSLQLQQFILQYRMHDVYFIPDSSDFSHMQFAHKSIRDRFGIKDHMCVITYTGGFSQEKGIDVVIALIHALSDYNTIAWVIAGSPKEQLVIPESLRNVCHVVSPLDRATLEEILSITDIGLEPKIKVTLQGSGKLLRYMSHGVPAVCFSNETSNWYVGGELQEYLAARSFDEYANKLKLLINTPTLRASVRRKLKSRAEEFSLEKIALQLDTIYHHVD